MKLSKAQQEVVGKMREGYCIRFSGVGVAYLYSQKHNRIDIRLNTFAALIRGNVVECRGKYINGMIYHLTKQYKSKQND